MQDKLRLRLINYAANSAELEKIPHRKFLDLVLQVMEERENGAYGSNMAAEGAMEMAQQAETSGENGLEGLDDDALGGILQSLEAFKG